jgi:hypothetical protein
MSIIGSDSEFQLSRAFEVHVYESKCYWDKLFISLTSMCIWFTASTLMVMAAKLGQKSSWSSYRMLEMLIAVWAGGSTSVRCTSI